MAIQETRRRGGSAVLATEGEHVHSTDVKRISLRTGKHILEYDDQLPGPVTLDLGGPLSHTSACPSEAVGMSWVSKRGERGTRE